MAKKQVTVILDSCIILEEWTSAGVVQGLRYAGKSFKTFNAVTKQWQQTWVDNTGGSTEYLSGKSEKDNIVFKTGRFKFHPDTMAIRKLSFYKLSDDRVRQHDEISKDDEKTWTTDAFLITGGRNDKRLQLAVAN
ncbi:MAG: hypothetical protein H7Y31_00505 [Chitinophagaceae bacterium]|nr:hypothetical protein [Chitinophagaceae bacterium]